MNNLERILDRINADADLEIKKIEEAADMRVESIQKEPKGLILLSFVPKTPQ